MLRNACCCQKQFFSVQTISRMLLVHMLYVALGKTLFGQRKCESNSRAILQCAHNQPNAVNSYVIHVALGKTLFGLRKWVSNSRAILQCAHNQPNAVNPYVGCCIRQKPIRLEKVRVKLTSNSFVRTPYAECSLSKCLKLHSA